MPYQDITVPKFKAKQNRLYGDLLKKQLGFVEGAAEGIDPYSLAESFRRDADRQIEGDSTGYVIADQTGDTGAQAAYELAQKNKATSQYNDILAYYNSPAGRAEIARMKAGLYGPETLTALQLLPSGFGPQSQGGGGLFGDILKVGATGASMGWTPFK